MNQYWTEVNERTDKSPLMAELNQLVDLIGIKILWIVAEHAKKQKETTDDDSEHYQF